jgi:hypothetical protein
MSLAVVRASVCLLVVIAGGVRAATAQTCIVVDESRDMLAQGERTAAVLLLRKQFEAAGQQTADTGCAATYTLSHIRLGTTIIVTIAGPLGSREGKALGLDDLPAVYSQMVRSLTTGQPMGSLAVLDRTNVSASQDLPARRVHSDGFWHARVGYATMFGDSAQPAASFGFGYRAEFSRLGLDVSFLNFQLGDEGGYGSSGSSAVTLVKLEGLYFANPMGNHSLYAGGGLSYGRTSIHLSDGGNFPTGGYGNGAGLQGELTVGYELARVTSARLFIQGDVTLPFYEVRLERFSYPEGPPTGRYVAPIMTTERRYTPSIALSIGLGWQRRR